MNQKSLSDTIVESLTACCRAPLLEQNNVWLHGEDLLAVHHDLQQQLKLNEPDRRTSIALVIDSTLESAAILVALLIERHQVVLLSDKTPASQRQRQVETLGITTVVDAGRKIQRIADNISGDPNSKVRIATSGSTGAPKFIGFTSNTLLRAAREIRQFNIGFGDPDIPGPDQPPLYLYSPPSHIAGFLTILRGAIEGRPVLIRGKFDPSDWVEFVRMHQPSTTGLPPTMMRMVLEASPRPDDLASLKSVWTGQMSPNPMVIAAFSNQYKVEVLGNYGATELCGAIAHWSLADKARFGDRKNNAVGRVAPSVAKARIVDPESRIPFDNTGEVGILELQVYRMGTEWIRTTDLASLDDDGFLYLHGRVDNAINRGGFNILPNTIIEVLQRHPCVRQAVVVAAPDQRLGQVPIAFVEQTNSEATDESRLKDHCLAELPAYMQPAQIHIVDKLPLTESGKSDFKGLRNLAAKNYSTS